MKKKILKNRIMIGTITIITLVAMLIDIIPGILKQEQRIAIIVMGISLLIAVILFWMGVIWLILLPSGELKHGISFKEMKKHALGSQEMKPWEAEFITKKLHYSKMTYEEWKNFLDKHSNKISKAYFIIKAGEIAEEEEGNDKLINLLIEKYQE